MSSAMIRSKPRPVKEPPNPQPYRRGELTDGFAVNEKLAISPFLRSLRLQIAKNADVVLIVLNPVAYSRNSLLG